MISPRFSSSCPLLASFRWICAATRAAGSAVQDNGYVCQRPQIAFFVDALNEKWKDRRKAIYINYYYLIRQKKLIFTPQQVTSYFYPASLLSVTPYREQIDSG